jgi:hypothetical protein
VNLVHLGLGTLQVVWVLMFFCVSLLSIASSFAMACVSEEVDRPSSLLFPFHPLLVLIKLQWHTDWEKMELLSFVVFPILVSLHDAWIESREPWCLLRMSWSLCHFI